MYYIYEINFKSDIRKQKSGKGLHNCHMECKAFSQMQEIAETVKNRWERTWNETTNLLFLVKFSRKALIGTLPVNMLKKYQLLVRLNITTLTSAYNQADNQYRPTLYETWS